MTLPHHPVLRDQVIQILAPQVGESYLDSTAGYGGHAAVVAEQIGPSGRLTLIDRDPQAIAALRERFGARAELREGSYLEVLQALADEGRQFDMILLDLGVSSPQLDNPERGFSFRYEAPLDMRMDSSQDITAADVVNRTRQSELERIIREYGEEPKARAVAAAIVAARPFHTTTELAQVVRTVALKGGDIDPATRTFQAIRIQVNAELEQLAKALPIAARVLALNGRIAVISFHSLEDRIVKQFFDQESRDCICPPKQPICTCGHVASLRKLTTKPIVADSAEIAFNPRARSAKLRAAENINKNKRRD